MTFFSLASAFLLVRFLFGNSPLWYAAAALQNTWLLILVPGRILVDWFVVNCYGASFALGFAALVLGSKKKWVIAIIFALLAHWVNFGVCLILFPLILIRYVFQRDRREFAFSFAIVLVGALTGWALMHISPWHETKIAFVSAPQWLFSSAQVLRLTREQVLEHPTRYWWFVAVPTIASGIALLIGRHFRAVQIAVALSLTAIFYWLFVSTQVWLIMGLYWPRYLYPSLLLLGVALAVVTVAPFERIRGSHAAWAISATVLMLSAGVYRSGKPSTNEVHHILDEKFGQFTPDILASDASALAGSYWTVWPAVFHANLALQEQGSRRIIYGLTYRSGETLRFWIFQPKVCLAVPDNDSEASNWMLPVGLHVVHMHDYSTLQTFCRR